MPEISVIVPVYNSEKYLEKSIVSILNQTFRDIEVICVNDGSTDNSESILRRISCLDPRLKVIHQDNAGSGAARNNGLRHAKGRYLSFLDSDDFFEPETLQKSHDKAIEYNADFVVYNSDQFYSDSGTFIKTPWVIRQQELPPYEPFTYRRLTNNIFKTFVGWAWDKLYLHSFVVEHDLWFQEQRTSNDLLFVFSALILAKRIAVVKDILAHHRRGDSESLSMNREESWWCFYDALLSLRERIKGEGLYEELEKDFINYALHFSLWNLDTLAEPARNCLNQKLCSEWFDDLGIKGKDSAFFYNKNEYYRYINLID